MHGAQERTSWFSMYLLHEASFLPLALCTSAVDPDALHGMQEENEAEEELLDAIATALTVVLKKFGDAAMPYVDALMPAVGTLLVRRHCETGSGHLAWYRTRDWRRVSSSGFMCV